MKIELTAQQANETIMFLKTMSDRLTKQHSEEHSGIAQMLLLGSIQSVDRLVVEISEQVEAQTEKVEQDFTGYQMTAQA